MPTLQKNLETIAKERGMKISDTNSSSTPQAHFVQLSGDDEDSGRNEPDGGSGLACLTSCNPPDQVTGLTVTPINAYSVTLNWTVPSPGDSPISDYTIQYRTYGTGGWTNISHDPSTNTSIELDGLTGDVVYEFQVAAVNDMGTGLFSDPMAFASQVNDANTDPSFDSSSNSTLHFLGINEFHTIQESVDAVDVGGMVTVAPGTYTEHVSISKQLNIGGNEGGLIDSDSSVILKTPDCDPALTMGGGAFIQLFAFIFDGNDPSHNCTGPTVLVNEALVFSALNIYKDSAIAFENNGGAYLSAVVLFDNVANAYKNDADAFYSVSFDNYFGDPSGPYEPNTNPSGLGSGIIGDSADNAFFRPFDINNMFTGDLGTDRAVLDPVLGHNVQSLFHNGGTFEPQFGESFADMSELSAVYVTEPVTIDVPTVGSSSTVYIPGSPSFFSPGWSFAEHSSSEFDGAAISAGSIDKSAVSNLPAGRYVANEVLQWGIPGVRLDVNAPDDPAQIGLYVGNGYEGQTLIPYRSESLTDGWTQDGLSDGDGTTCVVTDGYCNFETMSFSYFAATTDVPPSSETSVRHRHTTSGSSAVAAVRLLANPFLALNIPMPSAPPQNPQIQNFSTFSVNLLPGAHSDDVLELQKFLNAQGFIVSVAGPGSLGHETDVFGMATQAALAKFQEAHAVQILIPLGLRQGSGFFGDYTRNFVNQIIAK